jgi:hypothetical protein
MLVNLFSDKLTVRLRQTANEGDTNDGSACRPLLKTVTARVSRK